MSLHPVMAQALAPFIPARHTMNLTLTLNASDFAAVTAVLECRQEQMLEGNTPHLAKAHADACVYLTDQLLYGNSATTGLTAMLERVAAIQADENGEFAARRVQQAIDADLRNNRDKPARAHLAQTLNAVRLEQQHAQTAVA